MQTSTPVVPASTGVLINDDDPNDDPLTVVLVSPPAVGVFALATDGSFTWQPPPTFQGVDRFVYRALDPGGLFGEATVTLHITPPTGLTGASDDTCEMFQDVPEQVFRFCSMTPRRWVPVVCWW